MSAFTTPQLSKTIVVTTSLSHSRRRKTKCDGVKPKCRYCISQKVQCIWADEESSSRRDTRQEPIQSSQSNPIVNADGRSEIPTRDAGTLPTETQLSSVTKFIFPDQQVVRRCLDLFFERHFEVDFCSFLSRSELLINHKESPVIVISILALCSRYLTVEEVHQHLCFSSAREACRQFSSAARAMAREMSDKPSGKFSLQKEPCYKRIFKSRH